MAILANLKRKARTVIWKFLVWGGGFPFYVRIVLGCLFLVGGVLGFLPILGFWMIPLGLALIGLSLPFTDKPIRRWMAKVEDERATLRRLHLASNRHRNAPE